MAIDFNVKDIIHRITVKFVHNFLPGAKKKYIAKAVLQPELDIQGIASKASVYNITTSPKVIEEGLETAVELIRYLVADGYRIKTPLFSIGIRIPGEYDGTETKLPDGVHPEIRMTVSAELRQYVRDHVGVAFDGVEDTNGFIGQVVDETTGKIDQVITQGGLLTIHGYGLKIESDVEHKSEVGVFIRDEAGEECPVKLLALNEPRTLKVLAPDSIVADEKYRVVVRTQSQLKGGGMTQKAVRVIVDDNELIGGIG
jgi:hypothetical protein